MDGLECARAILEANPWARIILATGACEADLREVVDRLAGVLLKPISLKTLLREISACLESQEPG
jgi:DNA-binding NarL/FixJ family response regulator